MQTALITGASKGLGKALAAALAEQRWNVVLVARGRADLDAAVAELTAAGHRAWGIAADVATVDPARLVGEATALAGPIDLLVHNASTLGPTPLRSFLDTDADAFQQVLEVNVLGPFRLTRAVAGAMALRGRGTVLFISSDAGVEAYPTWGAYGVSKAAADQMANVWAAELPELRFLAVDPGEMNTAMHAAAVPEADPADLQDPADVAARLVALLNTPASGRQAA